MKSLRAAPLLALALLGGMTLSACKNKLTPEQEKELKAVQDEQYQILQNAAQRMQNEWGAAIVEIQVFTVESGFIEMRKRDSYDKPGKNIAVQFCKVVGDRLPAGSIRVQVYDEAHKSLEGIAYCYDDSGEAEKWTKLRQTTD